jgi:hypothetical protein
LIGFLRGQLINHDTPPKPAAIQSNPVAPVGVVRIRGQMRTWPNGNAPASEYKAIISLMWKHHAKTVGGTRSARIKPLYPKDFLRQD